MRAWIGLATRLIVLVIIGCGTMNAQTKPDESVVGKIAITGKGIVSFDGTVTTVDALKEKLADLKKRNGVVWYYREAATDEPPTQAMQVMKLIVDNGLPISMSTKPDYSDVLLPDGTTRPRLGVRQR